MSSSLSGLSFLDNGLDARCCTSRPARGGLARDRLQKRAPDVPRERANHAEVTAKLPQGPFVGGADPHFNGDVTLAHSARRRANGPRDLDEPLVIEENVVADDRHVDERNLQPPHFPVAPTANSCGGWSMSIWKPGCRGDDRRSSMRIVAEAPGAPRITRLGPRTTRESAMPGRAKRDGPSATWRRLARGPARDQSLRGGASE